MKYQDKTDAQLVELALKDSDGFRYLVERYEKKLIRYIRRLSGLSESDAEDILQEVFIKTYRNLNSYDPDLIFSSWIYRIAHNETINHIRKSVRSNTIPLETDDPENSNLIKVLFAEDDLPKGYSSKERGENVRKVLSMLSPKYKDILVLKFLEGVSYDEIGDILRIPIGTVGTLVNRAKSQFRQITEKNNIVFE